MSIAITREERDALYSRIVVRLSGIDDVYKAVMQEDWAAAQQLGQEFSDLLRLVCCDLGWGDSSKASFALGTPPDVLDRAARLLAGLARSDQAHHDAEARAAQEGSDEAGRLRQVCERILGQLDPGRVG